MSLNADDVKKIAHLARLNIKETEVEDYTQQLSKILGFIEQMNSVDTSNTKPLAHPVDTSQRLRDDQVSEENQRDKFQDIAPSTEAGLYLVPKVIEEA